MVLPLALGYHAVHTSRTLNVNVLISLDVGLPRALLILVSIVPLFAATLWLVFNALLHSFHTIQLAGLFYGEGSELNLIRLFSVLPYVYRDMRS